MSVNSSRRAAPVPTTLGARRRGLRPGLFLRRALALPACILCRMLAAALLGVFLAQPAPASSLEELQAYLEEELAAATLVEERLAAQLAAQLAELSADFSTSSSGAWLGGDCVTTGGLLSEQTVIDFWKANITGIGDLALALDTANYDTGNVVAAVREYGLTRDRALEGLAKSLMETLANGVAVLRRDIMARDHDPDDETMGCVDVGAALAEMVVHTGTERFSAGQKIALERLGDATAEDFGDALHKKEHEMLASAAMKGQAAFSADWLLDMGRLAVGGDDQVRQTFMIDALASPRPSPKVPEALRSTAAGMAAEAQIRQKSALSGVAGAALRRIAALQAPQPALVDAVAKLLEEAGSSDGLEKLSGDDGEGYSALQLVEARRRFFVSPNLSTDFGGSPGEEGFTPLDRASAVEAMRRVCRMLAAEFSLEVESFRGEVHDTVLLAALVGSRTEEANRAIEGYLSSARP